MGVVQKNITRCWQYSVESDRVRLKLVFHMMAEWIEPILFLTHFWGNSFAWLSLQQLFLFVSHINCVFLEDPLQRPRLTYVTVWPAWLASGGESCQADAGFCLVLWFKQGGILTGFCLHGEVVYDERLLPCELTDSVTQNANVLSHSFGKLHILSSHSP